MLRFTKEELIILLYHLTIMRKAFKKGIKKRHSKQEVNAYLETYQAIIDKLEAINPDDEVHEINFSHDELELLQSFMPWYINRLEAGINEEDKERLKEGFEILQKINIMVLIPA